MNDVLEGIPTPPEVAARPRDGRGYPALAITPWRDGVPQFASTGTARSLICAVERRCSICGLIMPPGPVWRALGAAEVAAVEAAQQAGHSYRNRAATAEAPGHRSCMLFAASVCPYLARPNARRGAAAEVGSGSGDWGSVGPAAAAASGASVVAHTDAGAPAATTGSGAAGFAAPRGAARGDGGAVAGFESYQYQYAGGVLFRFSGLVEFRRHDLGAEQLPELRRMLSDRAAGAVESWHSDPCPDYLMADEDRVNARFHALLDEVRQRLAANQS